jgi:hypothetical protein
MTDRRNGFNWPSAPLVGLGGPIKYKMAEDKVAQVNPFRRQACITCISLSVFMSFFHFFYPSTLCALSCFFCMSNVSGCKSKSLSCNVHDAAGVISSVRTLIVTGRLNLPTNLHIPPLKVQPYSPINPSTSAQHIPTCIFILPIKPWFTEPRDLHGRQAGLYILVL